MKTYGGVLVLMVGLCLLVASPAVMAEPGSALDKFKALAGEWEGQTTEGEQVKVSYQVFSNGSAVVETLSPQAEPAMVTVYHMDGSDLRLTHYCTAQNQPRLKAAGVTSDARVVSFSFVDATNLARPTAGHMHNLEVTFTDDDHITQKWTWMQDGAKTDNVFTLTRVK